MADKAKRFFPNEERKITNLQGEKFTDNNNKNRVDLYFKVGKTIVLMELKVRSGCRKHQLADYYFDIKNKAGNDQMVCIFYVTPTGEIPEDSEALVYSKDPQKKLIYEDANNANLFLISYSELVKNLSFADHDSNSSMARLISEFQIMCGHAVTTDILKLKAFHLAYLKCLEKELGDRLSSSIVADHAVTDNSEWSIESLLDSSNGFYQSISMMPKKCKEGFGWKLCFEVGYSCLRDNNVDREHLRILYGIKRTKSKNRLSKQMLKQCSSRSLNQMSERFVLERKW